MAITEEFDRQYLQHGLAVVPLLYRAKNPFANKGDGGHRFVFITRQQLETWPPIRGRCNWGLLGTMQVDPDDTGPTAWAKSMGVTSDCACWILRSRRGVKVIYRPPVDCPPTSCDPSHQRADLLGPRSLLVIPPSVHPSGFRYAWARGHSPADIPFSELAEPPAPIMDFWRSVAIPPKPPRAHGPTPGYLGVIYDAIVRKLEADGLRLRPARGGGLQGDCPFHCSKGRKAFIIDRERGWHCFAGCSDGESGRLTTLAVKLGVQL